MFCPERAGVMNELRSVIAQQDVIPLVALVLVFATGVICAMTAIISAHVRGYRERELAVHLIRELLERGLPPDEIASLVHASGVHAPDSLRCHRELVDRT
jgi:hypothetical protein